MEYMTNSSQIQDFQKVVAAAQAQQKFIGNFFSFSRETTTREECEVLKIHVQAAEIVTIPNTLRNGDLIDLFKHGAIVLTLRPDLNEVRKNKIVQEISNIGKTDVRRVFGLSHVVVCEPQNMLISDVFLEKMFSVLRNHGHLTEEQYGRAIDHFNIALEDRLKRKQEFLTIKRSPQ